MKAKEAIRMTKICCFEGYMVYHTSKSQYNDPSRVGNIIQEQYTSINVPALKDIGRESSEDAKRAYRNSSFIHIDFKQRSRQRGTCQEIGLDRVTILTTSRCI